MRPRPRCAAEAGTGEGWKVRSAMFELTVCTTEGKPLKRFDLSRLIDAAEGAAATGGVGSRVVVGRAEDCDIRIKSSSISRHHCAIELDEDDWVIRDLGSTHGTLVEGVQISEAAIVPGLEVVIGPAVLKFESAANRIAQDVEQELEGVDD